MAPYLATLMRASIVLQVAIDRGAAIRGAIDELSPFLLRLPLLEGDVDETLVETESIYDLHATVFRAMRLLDQNLICSPNTTHLRENMRRNLERMTYQLTRSTDRPTHLMHRILNRMAHSGLCDEARRLVLRYRVSLPIIRFSSAEFANLNDRDLSDMEFPPLERVNARDIPVAYARPVSSEPSSSRNSTPPLHAEQFINTTSGLGDRSRSISVENETGAWDTMLTTIEPDVTLPSASSSFASAAASASFSQDNSTSATTPLDGPIDSGNPSESFRILIPRSMESSFYQSRPSLPSLSHVLPSLNAPIPPSVLARIARYARLREQRPHSPPPEPDSRSSEMIDLESGPQPPLSPPSTGSPSSEAPTRSESQPLRRTYDPLSHPELSHMRTVLVGLAQSDEVPEDWWLSAGLTPYVLEAVRSQAQHEESRREES
jgi:hypothetical protein